MVDIELVGPSMEFPSQRLTQQNESIPLLLQAEGFTPRPIITDVSET